MAEMLTPPPPRQIWLARTKGILIDLGVVAIMNQRCLSLRARAKTTLPGREVEGDQDVLGRQSSVNMDTVTDAELDMFLYFSLSGNPHPSYGLWVSTLRKSARDFTSYFPLCKLKYLSIAVPKSRIHRR